MKRSKLHCLPNNPGRAAGGDAGDARRVQLAEALGDNAAQRLPAHLVGAVPEHRLSARIPQQHVPTAIDGDNRVVCCVQDRFQDLGHSYDGATPPARAVTSRPVLHTTSWTGAEGRHYPAAKPELRAHAGP